MDSISEAFAPVPNMSLKCHLPLSLSFGLLQSLEGVLKLIGRTLLLLGGLGALRDLGNAPYPGR